MFDGSRAQLSWLITGLIAAGYAAVGCTAELAYLAAGRDGHAQVTSVRPVCRYRSGLFSSRTYQDVTFAFTEPGGAQRAGTGRRPTGWTPDSTGRVAVRYTPGKDGRVRFAGAVDWLAVLLGSGAAVVGVAAAWRFAGGLRREVADARTPGGMDGAAAEGGEAAVSVGRW